MSKSYGMRALACAVALAFANILYQVFRDTPDYSVAAERSFFQAGGIFIYYWAWVRDKKVRS